MKLRVREVAFADNLVDDNAGNGASYLLELPNGAAGQVSGNAFINGPKAENRCRAMVVGAEGIEQDSTVAARNNRAFNLSERPVIILADLSGDVRESGNATDGWFVRRTGFAVKDRCVGCFLLRRLSEPRSGCHRWRAAAPTNPAARWGMCPERARSARRGAGVGHERLPASARGYYPVCTPDRSRPDRV